MSNVKDVSPFQNDLLILYHFSAGTVNPASFLRNSPQVPGYFFDGDANDPNVQNTIRGNFITLATGPFIIPFFCKDKPADCNANTVEVYAGTFIGIHVADKI